MKLRSLFISSVMLCLTGCAATHSQEQTDIDALESAKHYIRSGMSAEEAGSPLYAEQNYQRALRYIREDLKDDDEMLSLVLFRLGKVKSTLCEWDDAADYLKESLLIESKANGPDSPVTARKTLDLAYFYYDRELYEPSISYFGESIEATKNSGIMDSDPVALADIYNDYAVALEKTRQANEALSARNEAAAIRSQNPNRQAIYQPERYNITCPAR